MKKADFAVKQWQKQQPPCQQNQAHFDPVLLKPDYKLQSFGKDIIRAPSEGSGFGAKSMGFRFCPHHKGDLICLCFEGFDCGLCLAKPGSLEFWVKISLTPNSGWARTVDPCTPLPHFLSFPNDTIPRKYRCSQSLSHEECNSVCLSKVFCQSPGQVCFRREEIDSDTLPAWFCRDLRVASSQSPGASAPVLPPALPHPCYRPSRQKKAAKTWIRSCQLSAARSCSVQRGNCMPHVAA